jgi:hypothetical protein
MKFSKTQPFAEIIKIERIQNKFLWKVFSQELEMVAHKLNISISKVKTLDLYHGTSNTPPNLIYTSEEGFDMRFSPGGMWGRANYFAVNSSYSNSYAYSL